MPHRRTLALGVLAASFAVALAACGASRPSTVEAGAPGAAPAAASLSDAAVPAAQAPAASAPASASASAAASASVPAQATTGNIVQVAQSAGQFSTLLTAVEAAGLTTTLQGPGPFTVFAPTDAAFAKIPSSTLNALLADKAALTKVLTYHVLPAAVASNQISNGQTAATVEGGNVTFSVNGGTVKVNNATVVKADVAASNGVIHVIDAVLLPPDLALPETR